MSLNFDGSTEWIRTPEDQTEFDEGRQWTCGAFFRIENSATDDRSIISRWSGSHFNLRTNAEAAPTTIEVIKGATTITGAESIELNTWYCIVVAQSAGASNNTMTLFTMNMDGTFVDDGLTGTDGGDNAATSSDIGSRNDGDADLMDGDIQFPFYIDGVTFARNDAINFLNRPIQTVLQHGSNVHWLYYLGKGAVNAVDISAAQTTTTINGTPTVSDNPPVGPFYGYDLEWPPSVAAVVGVLGGAYYQQYHTHVIAA